MSAGPTTRISRRLSGVEIAGMRDTDTGYLFQQEVVTMTKNSKDADTSRTSKSTGTEVPTEPDTTLPEAQAKADADRREWEERMNVEAQEAEAARTSAPRS